MKTFRILAHLSLAGILAASQFSKAFGATDIAAVWSQLKPLTEASVVASGSVEAVCSDFQGPVVAWHDVRLAHFAVNDSGALLSDHTGLVAGGAVVLRDGSVKRGHVLAHNGMTLRNYSVNGALFGSPIDTLDGEDMGSYFLPAADVLNNGVLTAAFNYALSKPMQSFSSTAVLANASGKLVFGATSDAGCGGPQVYSVSSSDLAAASQIKIENSCARKIVVRVVGAAANFAHKGDVVVAASLRAEDVLWLIEDATLVEFYDVVLPGTLIAPFAKVVFHTGRLEGVLVAKDVEGNPNNRPFGSSFLCEAGDSAAQINFHAFELGAWVSSHQ